MSDYPLLSPKMTGLQLSRLCQEKGITVKIIQEYLNLSCPQSVYRWLKGRAVPSIDHLYALAGLLGVEVDDLLMGSCRKGMDLSRLRNNRFFYYTSLLKQCDYKSNDNRCEI